MPSYVCVILHVVLGVLQHAVSAAGYAVCSWVVLMAGALCWQVPACYQQVLSKTICRTALTAMSDMCRQPLLLVVLVTLYLAQHAEVAVLHAGPDRLQSMPGHVQCFTALSWLVVCFVMVGKLVD
jgi:hypothetical protein